jgi:hypothetical protein
MLGGQGCHGAKHLGGGGRGRGKIEGNLEGMTSLETTPTACTCMIVVFDQFGWVCLITTLG